MVGMPRRAVSALSGPGESGISQSRGSPICRAASSERSRAGPIRRRGSRPWWRRRPRRCRNGGPAADRPGRRCARSVRRARLRAGGSARRTGSPGKTRARLSPSSDVRALAGAAGIGEGVGGEDSDEVAMHRRWIELWRCTWRMASIPSYSLPCTPATVKSSGPGFAAAHDDHGNLDRTPLRQIEQAKPRSASRRPAESSRDRIRAHRHARLHLERSRQRRVGDFAGDGVERDIVAGAVGRPGGTARRDRAGSRDGGPRASRFASSDRRC